MSAKPPILPRVLRDLMLPALLCVGACTGTDTGNPFTQPLVVDAHSSAPGEVAISLPGGGVLVTEAWLSIEEVGISEACGTPQDASIGDIGVADHAADEALHADFEAKEGTYCELQVPWVIAADGARDDGAGSYVPLTPERHAEIVSGARSL